MSQVAERAQVAAGTIYRYFPSKEALLEALYLRGKEEMAAALRQGMRPGASLRQQFEAAWLNLYRFYVADSERFKFLDQYARSPLISPELRQKGMEGLLPMLAVLQGKQAQETFKPLQPELTAQLAYGHVVACAQLHLSGEYRLGTADERAAVQTAWDMLAQK